MKKLLFILLVLISCICQASNLEFSQVILIDGFVAFSRTVPAGKVWKIESSPRITTSSSIIININGKEAILSLNTSNGALNFLPIWLPEGTVISDYAISPSWSGWISIVEYTVVP